MLGQPDGFDNPQSQEENEEGKQMRQRRKRWATPPRVAFRLKDRQLSRGWGEWILSSNLCLHDDEAILWGGVIGEAITLSE